MITIRRGKPEDIDTLVTLRVQFLQETGNLKDLSQIPDLQKAHYRYFEEELNKGFLCWLAVDGPKVVATSGLVFHRRPPVSGNPSGINGYIMNVYTLPEYRKMGIATTLMKEIIQFLKEQGITCIRLHATRAGRPVYEKLGFKAKDDEMELCV